MLSYFEDAAGNAVSVNCEQKGRDCRVLSTCDFDKMALPVIHRILLHGCCARNVSWTNNFEIRKPISPDLTGSDLFL